MSTLSGALARVPTLFVIAGLVAVLTLGIIVWRARRDKRRRPTRLELIVAVAVVVVLAVAVILIPVRNSGTQNNSGDRGSGSGSGEARTAGPTVPSGQSTPDSTAAPAGSSGSTGAQQPGPNRTNDPRSTPRPTSGAVSDGVAPAPQPGPGPAPDLGPTSIDDCYSQASWESSDTDQVFTLWNNGFLSVHGSRTGVQYLPRAAIPCNGVLSFQHDYGGQLNVDSGSLIDAGTEPTRERCQDNDHYSSAKLAANAKNAHLCAITGDGDEWMVVRIVETAALPQSVQLQLVGFFPK